MWFRRRQRAVATVPLDDEPDERVRILPCAPALAAPEAPAVRVERYVVALAFHAAQLEDRIVRLERAASAQAEAHLDLPDHNDLLEVRLHSSRVSADLGRLALELRSEISEIKDEADRAARTAERAAASAALAQDPDRLVELAEQLLEMADAVDARRRAS